MVLPDHQPLSELTHLPIEMPVEAAEDETMIADTIVEAAEAMGLYTSAQRQRYALLNGCHHAFVMQLWWYRY